MQLRHLPRSKSGTKYHAANPGRPVPMNDMPQRYEPDLRHFPDGVDRVQPCAADYSIPTLETIIEKTGTAATKKLIDLIERQTVLEKLAWAETESSEDSLGHAQEAQPPAVCHEFQAARLFLSHFGFLSIGGVDVDGGGGVMSASGSGGGVGASGAGGAGAGAQSGNAGAMAGSSAGVGSGSGATGSNSATSADVNDAATTSSAADVSGAVGSALLTVLDTKKPGFAAELQLLDRLSARTHDTLHVFYVRAGQTRAADIVENMALASGCRASSVGAAGGGGSSSSGGSSRRQSGDGAGDSETSGRSAVGPRRSSANSMSQGNDNSADDDSDDRNDGGTSAPAIDAHFWSVLHSLGDVVRVDEHAGWTGTLSTSWHIRSAADAVDGRDDEENASDADDYDDEDAAAAAAAATAAASCRKLDGEQHVLYWADVGAEIAFVVPTHWNYQRGLEEAASAAAALAEGSCTSLASSASSSTMYERSGAGARGVGSGELHRQPQLGHKPRTLSLELDRGTPSAAAAMPRLSHHSPHMSNDPVAPSRRRTGVSKAPAAATGVKIMLVWIESFEDHLSLPIGKGFAYE